MAGLWKGLWAGDNIRCWQLALLVVTEVGFVLVACQEDPGSNPLTSMISFLKSSISLAVKVSALAMMGTTAHILPMADIMIQSVCVCEGVLG